MAWRQCSTTNERPSFCVSRFMVMYNGRDYACQLTALQIVYLFISGRATQIDQMNPTCRFNELSKARFLKHLSS